MAMEDPIAEEREEKMLSGGWNPTVKIGRFLKPCADCPEKAASVPVHVPLLSETMSRNLTKWPSEVLFKGCKRPRKEWKKWVHRMAMKHETTWRRAGIYDSILSSTYEIHVDRDLLLGLSEYWCSDTNTFVFPWGEATMTLEDMMILGGLSVLGQPINIPLTKTLNKTEKKLIAEHRRLNSRNAKKAGHSTWINRFMGSEAEGEPELEHVALLALWLSRNCFPSHPEGGVGKHVFSFAIHLSQGTRLALAPAVLAGLYKDLRFMKEQVYLYEAASVTLWAPFQLLQLWVWERFSLLRPIDSPRPLFSGEPRVGRWHKANSKRKFILELPRVRSILKDSDNFSWRPYGAVINNWRFPSFYKEKEELKDDESCLVNDELQSFVRCLRSCELVGLDYMEQYLPHRVARQFGFDQDLPGHFPRVDSNLEIAWSIYGHNVRDPSLYIRCRFVEVDCTERYSEWWKQCMLVRRQAIKDVLEEKRQMFMLKSKKNFKGNPDAETEASKTSNSWGDHPPGFAPKKDTFRMKKPIAAERKTMTQKFGTDMRNENGDDANFTFYDRTYKRQRCNGVKKNFSQDMSPIVGSSQDAGRTTSSVETIIND